MPASGRSTANRSRIDRRTGISRSAHSIRRTPSAARPRSITSWAGGIAAAPSLAAPDGGAAVSVMSVLPASEDAPDRSRDVRPWRAEAMGEALLEPDVLGKAEAPVGLERRWV